MTDIDRIKTKRIFDELLTSTEIKVYNLSENAAKAEMALSQIITEQQRAERLMGDITSILRGFEHED